MMRHSLWQLAAATIVSLALLLGGCGSANKPAPGGTDPGGGQNPPITNPNENPPSGQKPPPPSGPNEVPAQGLPDLPGDMTALEAAFKAETPVTYTILVADAPRGVDITRYLDQLLDERGYPDKSEVLLVIFPKDNHNIRFAMGAMLFDKKISLQSMLEMVQNRYLTKARNGDPAGGLADLILAINQQVK